MLARREPELTDRQALGREFAGCLRLILDGAERLRTQRRLEELTRRRLPDLSEDERREFARLTARKAPNRGRSRAPAAADGWATPESVPGGANMRVVC